MRCPECGAIAPTGCLCNVEDGTCFEWLGNGSEDEPYVLWPVLDVDADQLLECESDGLLALLPLVISHPPVCRAFHSSNISIANNTLTAVNLDSEEYDTDTMHSTSSNNSRITFTTAGTYTVTFNCMWNKTVAGLGDREAFIRVNGSSYIAHDSKRQGGADLFIGHSVVAQDDFGAGDYVEGVVRQTTGTNLLLLSASHAPFLDASYV